MFVSALYFMCFTNLSFFSLPFHCKKGMVETDPEGALAGFAEVVSMEPEKAEW